MTRRTFAVFQTEAFRAGEVYDETFHAHARALMEPLRDRLVASGLQATTVEEHSFYGVAFTLQGAVLVLLQAVDPWLLTLSRKLGFLERLRGAREDAVDEALVGAVDAELTDLGVVDLAWYTAAEYEAAARKAGPIAPGP